MTRPERDDTDAMVADAMVDEPDFAEEHTGPTYADEQGDQAGMEADESTPDDSGGMDLRGSNPP